MTSFAAAELRALQRLRAKRCRSVKRSSLCALHERFECSVAALSALRYDDAHTLQILQLPESRGFCAARDPSDGNFRPALD